MPHLSVNRRAWALRHWMRADCPAACLITRSAFPSIRVDPAWLARPPSELSEGGAGDTCTERDYAHVEASSKRIWNLHRWSWRRSRPRSGQSDGRRGDGAAPVGLGHEDVPENGCRLRWIADR